MCCWIESLKKWSHSCYGATSGHLLNFQTFVRHTSRSIQINLYIHNELHLMIYDADFERVLSFWAAWEQLQTAQEDTASELWGWLFLFIVQQLSYFHFARSSLYQLYENMTSNQDRSNSHTLVIGIHCKLQFFSSLSSPADKLFISSSFHFRPNLGIFLRSPSWRWWREEKQAGSVTRPAERKKILQISKYSHLWNILKISIEKRDWSSSCVFLRTSPVVKIQNTAAKWKTHHTYNGRVRDD